MDSRRKVALITGGSRGIGKAIALELAARGVDVAINYQNQEGAAKRVASAIHRQGGEAMTLRADVSQASEVKEMMAQVLKRWGQLDILVNNAGITRDGLLMRLQDEDWTEVLDVNLKGAFLCARAAIRPMIHQRWGRVINISSIVGSMGNPGQTNYSASKAGLLGFTKSLAKEVASRNITVNAIAPGYIATDIVERLSDRQRRQILSRIPTSRFGTPEDVAHIAGFLTTDEASYITGQVIGVDGGLGIS